MCSLGTAPHQAGDTSYRQIKADPELHSALIFIKKLLCEGVEDKYKFWLAFENHDLINKTATKEQLLAEAEEIKKFYRSITPEEVTTIRSFLSSNVHRFHLHRYHPFLSRRSEHTLSIDVLLKILQESRAIKSRNVFQRLISKLGMVQKKPFSGDIAWQI
jgi:hypothetical protein